MVFTNTPQKKTRSKRGNRGKIGGNPIEEVDQVDYADLKPMKFPKLADSIKASPTKKLKNQNLKSANYTENEILSNIKHDFYDETPFERETQFEKQNDRRDWESDVNFSLKMTPSYMKRLNSKSIEEATSSSSQTLHIHSSPATNSTDLVDQCSTNNMWNPVSFAKKYLFDSFNGVALDQSVIQDNLKRLDKNFKLIDSSPFLNLASHFHKKDVSLQDLSLGMAFIAEMLNKSLKKSPKVPAVSTASKQDLLIRKDIGFDLEQAKRDESLVFLPTGRYFKMSDKFSVYHASSYSSSNYATSCKSILRHIFTQVAKEEPFFPAFSTSHKTKSYVPFGEEFFTAVSSFLLNGFHQDCGDHMKTYTIRLTRDVLDNAIDRARSVFNSEMLGTTNAESLGNELKEKLKCSGNQTPRTPLAH